MPRVLITNDDGYLAPGIRALAPAIAQLGYDVLVVAPLVDESGVGSARARMIDRPIRTAAEEEHGVTFTGIDGTPALAVTRACSGRGRTWCCPGSTGA
ncbi:5'/3'-nucleotidase SurE [Kribbella sp. NPDC004536]|uniref:5'/3'-nucleotidase SurE n=1 Tax=Kribbella sp. NPDC004536 TaxID=3364106 RepID=UPI0036ABCE81